MYLNFLFLKMKRKVSISLYYSTVAAHRVKPRTQNGTYVPQALLQFLIAEQCKRTSCLSFFSRRYWRTLLHSKLFPSNSADASALERWRTVTFFAGLEALSLRNAADCCRNLFVITRTLEVFVDGLEAATT